MENSCLFMQSSQPTEFHFINNPIESSEELIRYLFLQLSEKFPENQTIRKLSQDILLDSFNQKGVYIHQMPVVDRNTYRELLQTCRVGFLHDHVNLNSDEGYRWKICFETSKGTQYTIETYDSELKFEITNAKTRTLTNASVGGDHTYVTVIGETLDDKGQVRSSRCDVNCYDRDGNQLPVPNRLDEIRYALATAEWNKQLGEIQTYYEMIDMEGNLNDRYSFTSPISLDQFYEKFKDLILPAGSFWNVSQLDSRLLDNMTRFIDLTHKIENQLGEEGDVLLSEALVEPISTHFGMVEAVPSNTNGLAIVKKKNQQYTMVTLNVSCENGNYAVSSYKQDAAIDDVMRCLNRSFRNTQVEGLTAFTDGAKVSSARTFQILPARKQSCHKPLLPRTDDILEEE